MKQLSLVALALAVAPSLAEGQGNPAAQAARQWRQQNERAVLEEFVDFLRLPNVTREKANVRRNADFIVRMLEKREVAATLVSADDANPIVFGEIRTPGASRTIAFYAHYDGQPLDEAEWATPPFTPTFRSRAIDRGGEIVRLPERGRQIDPESRLYARSSSDDKAPIMAMVAALDAVRAAGLQLKSNIKFAFDGEEEAGSPNLERMLAANKELFRADLWLFCDGPVHQTGRPLVAFGARDSVRLDLTVYGPKSELHSGHYGNWAPNPAMLLARLLASMKDETGRVLVEGFYDEVEPLGELERRAMAEAPPIDSQLKEDLWLAATEGMPLTLAELVTRPALNVRGMRSSRVGPQASNVIPATATASLDIRLVKGMDPRRTQDRVVEHVRKQGFFVVDAPPDGETRRKNQNVVWVDRGKPGIGAVRTPMDLPVAQEVIGVVESVLGPAVKVPNMGGTLPLADIERPLGTRTIVVPIVNHDNNQHSFDENLRIQNLWDGIELMAALLTM